jgi:hypothetical protein
MQDEMNDFVNPYYKDPSDIVSVVRCKNCKHFDEWLGEKMCSRGGYFRWAMKPEDFCSYGVRKE